MKFWRNLILSVSILNLGETAGLAGMASEVELRGVVVGFDRKRVEILSGAAFVQVPRSLIGDDLDLEEGKRVTLLLPMSEITKSPRADKVAGR